MAGSRIVSLGHYQPSRVLTNDDLAQMVDTTDEWIQSRLGIKTRRIAAGEETVADMASAAAAKALAASGLTAGRHRPRRRGDLLLGRPVPQRRHPGGGQAGHHRARRVRPQHRLLGLLLRAGHGGPRHPGRRRRATRS